MDTKKLVMASIAGALMLGVGGAAGYLLHQPEVEIKEVPVPTPFEVEKIVEVEKEVLVEVAGAPVEVFVEDEEFLKKACDRLMYEDIQECKEEVSAEDDAFKLALELLGDENKVFDVLEDEGLIADEDEAKLIKVYKDFEDVEVVESDFEEGDYEFKIKARVEDTDNDVKKKFVFTVKVSDGEAEIDGVVLDE